MTRINCIKPAMLSSKHLVAEYRELPRVFGLAHAAMLRGESPADPRNPTRYTLGRGHVRFFYSRCGYLRRRFRRIVAEMIRRGYAPQHLDAPAVYEALPLDWCTHWTPDRAALAANLARLLRKDPHHYRPLVARK